MFELNTNGARNSDIIIYDDFSAEDEAQSDTAELSQHPALIEAYRFAHQLENLVITDLGQFRGTLDARLKNLNERIENSLYDHPVTVYAPVNRCITPTMATGIGNGNIAVYSDAPVFHEDEDEGEGDTLDSLDAAPIEHLAANGALEISGPFGGFTIRYDAIDELDLAHDDADPCYKPRLFVRVQECYVESALADVTVYNVAELACASVMFDEDTDTENLDISSEALENYAELTTETATKLSALQEQIHSSDMSLIKLRKLDSSINDLFCNSQLAQDFPLHELESYIQAFMITDNLYKIITSGILYIAHDDQGNPIYQHNLTADDPDSVNVLSARVERFSLLPRSIVETSVVYGTTDETLGLYLSVQLPNTWGHIPVESIQAISLIPQNY